MTITITITIAISTTTTTTTTTTTSTRSINSTRGFHASTFRAVSARYARYARLRFARVPRVLFCAGSARVAAFKYLQEIYILRRILLLYLGTFK